MERHHSGGGARRDCVGETVIGEVVLRTPARRDCARRERHLSIIYGCTWGIWPGMGTTVPAGRRQDGELPFHQPLRDQELGGTENIKDFLA